MDLIPRPDQVVAAAGNVAHALLHGGLADLRPMPRTLIDDGELREVYHYRPAAGVPETGDPVLLVTPLAAPALCFDLRRGCSLVEHLVTQGRPTYLVDYGQVSLKDRALGMEHWVDEVLPAAIRAVHEHSGGKGVHLVGWSLGGIFALLVAADRQDLPIASLSVLGSPVDVRTVPLVAPVRPLLDLTRRGLVTRALGAIPRPLVDRALAAASAQTMIARPLAVLTHLDDTDHLAQLEAVDRFQATMSAYPGRTYGQLYHRFVKGNALAGGSMEIGDRTIDLSAIEVPVLVFAGTTDGIAPLPAVRAVVPLLPGSREVRFEIVPGGHLGMLTGRAAREATWPVIDEWVARWSVGPVPPEAPREKAAAKKTAAKKTPAKKTPAKKTSAKKTPARRAPAQKAPAPDASPRSIGSNPSRRYGSAGSRALGQR